MVRKELLDTTDVGAPNGVAPLDGAGRVPDAKLPTRLGEAGLSATIGAVVPPLAQDAAADFLASDPGVTAAAVAAAGPAAAAVTNGLSAAAAADAYTTPPTALTATLGTLTPTAASITALRRMVIATASTHQTTIPSVLRTVFGRVSNDEVGRTLRLYMLRPNGSGGYSVLYDSGVIPAATAGNYTHTVPAGLFARLKVGDVPGAWTSTSTGANGLYVAQSGGNAIGAIVLNSATSVTAPVVGDTITPGTGGYTSSTQFIPAIGYTYDHESILVATRWAGKAGGYPRLDEAAHLDPRNLPAASALTLSRSTAVGDVETVEYDAALGGSKTVLRPDTAAANYVQATPALNQTNTGTYPGGRIVIGWQPGAVGFAKTGTLTRLVIPPGGTRNVDSKVQAWVVRPTSTPGAAGSTLSFTVVATIGEASFTDTTRYTEFADLAIPVKAGDMIALRPINAGMRYGAGFAAAAAAFYVDFALAGTALTDLTSVDAKTVATGRIFDMTATVIPGPFHVGTGPNGTARLDTAMRLPAQQKPVQDDYWRGRRVLTLGTSITVGANASYLADGVTRRGFIYQALVENAGMVLDNQALGSSGIVWNGTRALSLGATAAELTAAGFAATESYETRILARTKPELIVFDHLYNDRDMALGTITDSTGASYYGAYNRVLTATITQWPDVPILLVASHSSWAPQAEGDHPQTRAKRDALKALADKYGCGFLDMLDRLGINSINKANTAILADGVHPADLIHARMARILYGAVRSL